MTDPRPVTPIGFALGFALAFSATIGIFVAYWIGHGNPALFWSALIGSLVVGGALGYGLRRFVTLPNASGESSAEQRSSAEQQASAKQPSTEQQGSEDSGKEKSDQEDTSKEESVETAQKSS